MDVRLVAVERPPVLRRVDLRVRAGVTRVGGDAEGRAALVRLLALRWMPRAGRVLMNGRNVCAMAHRERSAWRRRIGFAPAGSHLPEGVTVDKGLAYVASLWQVSGLRPVHREIERWGLSDLGRRRLGELSPGERRRFVLAASRVMDPEMWILERPYDGIDAATAATLDVLVADTFFGRGPVRTLVLDDDSARACRLPCHHLLEALSGAVRLKA